MKKVLLAAMTVVLLGATAQAVTHNVTVNAAGQTAGWMNVGVTSPTDWGSGWGQADLRSTFLDGQTVFLQTNVNGANDNAGDPYWAPGALVMEANTYGEVGVAGGDVVSYDFHTVANELASQGYSTVAFVKVLDPAQGWATTQVETYDIAALGTANITLNVVADGVAQYGFAITGANDISGSATDALGVTVIPEPATIGLVGIAGLGLFFARRRI